MELPHICAVCNALNWIDHEMLEIIPIDKIIKASIFTCERCGRKNVIAYSTVSLMEQMQKLNRYSPEHPKFSFLFSRLLRKAEGVRMRGEELWQDRT